MADGQFSYNGWSFGDGTAFDIVEIDGLGIDGIRSSLTDLPTGDGAFPGVDYYSTRVVRFRLEVTGTSAADRESNIDTMRRATVKQSADLPLTLDLWGQTAMRLECRPTRRRAVVNHTFSLGELAVYDLEFLAADPLFYESAATNTVIGTGTAVTNAGDSPAKWTCAITGSTNPTLTHVGSGLVLDFSNNGGLSGAVDIVSSHRARTVTQSGTNRYDRLTAVSEFFLLDAGANSLTYTGGGTCTLTHRGAYAALV